MYWRWTSAEFSRRRGAGARRAFRRIVKSNGQPGVLAYADGQPVGWCAVGPRAEYPRLGRSRVLAPVDDRPVWAISCLYVARPWRRRGVSGGLIKAAAAFARRRGARILEGYPVEPRTRALPDIFAWTGFSGAFRRAGFREVLRRSPTRPIVRCVLR
jgi:GNAT superfamily N-acetyltransferase